MDDAVSMWALFDELKHSHPWIYLLLELFLGPSAIYAGLTMLPLIIGGRLLDRHPHLQHLSYTIALRWAPIGISLLVGYGTFVSGHIWGAFFLLSGAASATLESASQVLAMFRLRTRSAALRRVLAEATGLERAV